MFLKLSLERAGTLVDRFMQIEKANGKKFREHAFETLVNAVEIGVDEEKFYAMIDAYIIPKGIKMPWGTWVKP